MRSNPSSSQNLRLKTVRFIKLSKTITATRGGGGGGRVSNSISSASHFLGKDDQRPFLFYLIGRSSQIHRSPSGQPPQQQQQLGGKCSGRDPDRLAATATAAAGHLTAPSPPEAADESGSVRGCSKVQWQRPLESSANT